jgi:ATP-binding cassette, subfamily B, bacterial
MLKPNSSEHLQNGFRHNLRTYTELWYRTFTIIWAVIPYWLVAWVILLVLQGVLPGATVYLTKLTIDSFSATINSGHDFAQINYSIALLVITGGTLLIGQVFQSLASYVNAAKADILSDHLKNLIHLKAIEVDYSFYESPSFYDLLEQARSDSLSKPVELLQNFGSIFQSLITLLTFSTILVVYGWWIPLLLLLGALPSLLIYFRYDRIFHAWVKSTTTDRRMLMYYETMICHSKTAAEMRLFELNGRFRELFQALRLRLRGEKMNLVRRQFAGKLLAETIALLTAGTALGWMAINVLYRLATLGDLAVFYQIFSRGQSIIQTLFAGVGKAISNTLYLEQLFEFLELQPTILSPEDPIKFPEKIRFGIEFRGVGFRYPGDERPVIENFDLFIPAGKITAIVGVNGAGKSTLIKLLCRFYDPDEGIIEIDGIDIRKFRVDELRQNLSLHFQEPMQYHETAAQNIAFGDMKREAQLGEIEQAGELAGTTSFIKELPQKYDTFLGKLFVDGCELSGGQWQRLALARAYFRKAQILILDEPTSAMDSWAESDWFGHLRELTAGRIGFVITHRFTIAMRADVIHVIDQGRIQESGTHSELTKIGKKYAQSWDAQMNSVREDKNIRKEDLYTPSIP